MKEKTNPLDSVLMTPSEAGWLLVGSWTYSPAEAPSLELVEAVLSRKAVREWLQEKKWVYPEETRTRMEIVLHKRGIKHSWTKCVRAFIKGNWYYLHMENL